MPRFPDGVVDALVEALLTQGGIWGLVLGLVVPAAWGTWKEVKARQERHKALSYHVLFNSPLGLDPPDAGHVIRLHDRRHALIADPSIVVVRLTNAGAHDIQADDYQLPVSLSFGSRTVQTVDVTESQPPELVELIGPGLVIDRNRIVLPREHLNAGTRFKLLVLLSGGSTDETVQVGGLIRGGTLVDARTQQRRNARTWRVVTAVFASLCAGALAVALLFSSAGLRPTPPGAPRCAEGDLVVGGSSAFATAIGQAAGSYSSYCGRARIRIATSNSRQGLEQLRDATPAEAAGRLAFSDGPAEPGAFPGLVERAIAIVPYTIVVHPSVVPAGVDRLTLTRQQVRAVFDGRQKTWRDLDRRLPPIPVKIIGRGQSGTRDVFERHVLGDGRVPRPQGTRTSSDCVSLDYAANASILCEESTTAGLLRRVAEVPGAIGYADAPDATSEPGVAPVSLDDRNGTVADIRAGYPFWTVEFVYRRGTPAEDRSLAAAFVDHLAGDVEAAVLGSSGYPPCSRHADLCRRR
ncbi:substrate-binding domain-containing protein [Micromonospora sp. NPDC047074]|uniref:PstS family phosphate ABC transporter substrate-binding protein n=1 Tax=Micromonospora sp. NPDC047074 TaxID=3154339 RepID=UPI0033CF3663